MIVVALGSSVGSDGHDERGREGETRRVDDDHRRQPPAGIEQPAGHRPDETADVVVECIEGVGGDQPLFAYQAGQEG